MKAMIVVAAAVAALLSACASMRSAALAASATVEPRSGSAVAGTVRLTEAGGRVRAHVEFAGLVPNSEHGFHVHDKGDCSAPDAASAGGHFNPGGSPHGRAGGAGSPPHHAGDLPNLHADASGKVRADLELAGVTLAAGPTSIVGRSLIVHRDADDYTTQPSGNSGPRIACGVITPS
jgi:superoxide dismutase, Cu-Zn family